MKDIKIYFLGRTQGYSIHKYFPSKIENRRRYEKDGFYSVDGIKRTLFKSKADILFFRNKPEKTTDKIIYSLSNEINNINKQLIINDIRSFNKLIEMKQPNPYTMLPIPKEVIKRSKKLITMSRIYCI